MANYYKKLTKFHFVFGLTTIIIYIFYLLSASFLSRGLNFIIAGIIGLISLILYIIRKEKFHDLYCYINSVGIGFVIGGYFSKYDINYKNSIIVLLSILMMIIIVNLLVRIVKHKRTIVAIFLLSLIVFNIYSIANFRNNIIFPEILYLSIYLIILFIGLIFFMSYEEDVEVDVYRLINLTYFAAFFIIFFVVLLIVTEGESIELDFSGFSGGNDRKERNLE